MENKQFEDFKYKVIYGELPAQKEPLTAKQTEEIKTVIKDRAEAGNAWLKTLKTETKDK